MADWAGLVPDLLSLIAKKVDSYEDFAAFGGVCQSWRSVAAVKDNFCPANQVPWLVLPEEERVDGFCDFYSLTKRAVVRTVHLPEVRSKILRSSFGWLITVDKNSGKMELLHPLSRAQIHLPAGNFRSLEIKRAVLSASPSQTEDYTLMVITGEESHLAYWKPGNTSWSIVVEDTAGCYEDVVYYRNKFYAINNFGNLFYVDFNSPNPTTAKLVGMAPMRVPNYQLFYLVESGGDLLAVFRLIVYGRYREDGTYDDGYYMAGSFFVYRILTSGEMKGSDFEQIVDLGGRSLFVGNASAVSIVAGAPTIRPNCIYFTGESKGFYYYDMDHYGMDRAEREMGIYNLQEESIESFYGGSSGCLSFWITPSF